MIKKTELPIIIGLFQAVTKKKNISTLLLQIFSKKNNSAVQIGLLSLDLKELNDVTLLTKLSKRSASDDVVQLIDNKLAELIEQQEKPKKLLKQCQFDIIKIISIKRSIRFQSILNKKIDFRTRVATVLT